MLFDSQQSFPQKFSNNIIMEDWEDFSVFVSRENKTI